MRTMNGESFFRIVVEFRFDVSSQAVDASEMIILATSEVHSDDDSIRGAGTIGFVERV